MQMALIRTRAGEQSATDTQMKEVTTDMVRANVPRLFRMRSLNPSIKLMLRSQRLLQRKRPASRLTILPIAPSRPCIPILAIDCSRALLLRVKAGTLWHTCEQKTSQFQ
jgi:hypothetical protein